jgi:hypothetical protein
VSTELDDTADGGVQASVSQLTKGPTHLVGASNTDAGREVCAATRRGPDAPVVCKILTMTPTVSIDYPDGRFAAGVTPIVLEP